MIQNVQNSGRTVRVRASDRLRVHFLSLARRVVSWQRPNSDPGCLTLGVTAVESGAGSSMVAFNLAANLASICHGNVLFVECGFGKPNIGRRLSRPGYGLSEVLGRSEAPTRCIHQTSIDKLYFMGPGRVELRLAMELPFEGIKNLNTELDESFEYVVYDLPAARETTPCYPIAQHLDAAIIVTDAHGVDEVKINCAARRFEELETPLIGLVLNKA